MSTRAVASRVRIGFLVPSLLLLIVTGCSGPSPVSGALPPKDGEVQFTSDSGFLTINVPEKWRECTSEANQVFAQMGMPSQIVAAWDLDDGAFFGGASVVISTFPVTPTDRKEALATQAWTMLSEIYGNAEFQREADLITPDAQSFVRMDMTLTTTGMTMIQVSLISIVDDMGVEIAVTLIQDTIYEKDRVLEALASLVFG